MVRRNGIYIAIAGIMVCVTFLAFPQICAESLVKMLGICLKSLVPSLFPFMIASDMLLEAGRSRGGIGKTALLIMGLIFGFPIGARGASVLYSEGQIGRADFVRLVSCAGIPSIGFVLGVCGTAFGRKRAVILYLIILLSALFCYFVMPSDKETVRDRTHYREQEANRPFFSALSDAVGSSAIRMLTVCGYVSFFYTLANCLSAFTDDGVIKALICGFFEFSGGCVECGKLNREIGFILCAGVLAFSGVSVFMQCVSVQDACGIIPLTGQYLVIRCIMAVISVAGARMYIIYRNTWEFGITFVALLIVCLGIVRLLQRIYTKRLKKERSRCIINKKTVTEC